MTTTRCIICTAHSVRIQDLEVVQRKVLKARDAKQPQISGVPKNKKLHSRPLISSTYHWPVNYILLEKFRKYYKQFCTISYVAFPLPHTTLQTILRDNTLQTVVLTA